jgi:hypothetical protein
MEKRRPSLVRLSRNRCLTGGGKSQVRSQRAAGPATNLAAHLADNLYADMTMSSVPGICKLAQDGTETLIAPGVFGSMAAEMAGDIFVNQGGNLQEITLGCAVPTIATGCPPRRRHDRSRSWQRAPSRRIGPHARRKAGPGRFKPE